MFSLDTILWLTLKGSVTAALALVATTLLRRRPAAVRHAIWVIAVVAQLLMPLSTRIEPARTLQVPMPVKVLDAAATPALPAAAVDPRAATPSKPGSHFPTFDLRLLLVAGTALLLLRLLAGTLRIAWIARRSERVIDGEWLSLTQQIAGTLGIRRPVTLIHSGDVRLPVTWGFFYPTILLPRSAHEWPAALRKHVLIHELAHVRRTDALTQLAGQMVIALFWFNPLSWIAVRRMSVEAENACDDYVLRGGERPSVYAATLVELVRAHTGAEIPAFASLSVGRRSELEQRVRSITSPLRDPSTRRALFAVAVFIGVLIVLPLSAVQRATHAAIEQTPLASIACRPLAVPDAPFSETSGTLTKDDGTTVHYFFLRPAPNRCIETSFAMNTRFTDDDRDIVAQPGAEALLREKSGNTDRAARITERNGTLERRLTVDGRPAAWDERWYRGIMPELVRRSTAGVDARAARIVANTGVDGLVAELERIPMTSVRHDYLVALLSLRTPDQLPRDRVIAIAREELTDFEPDLAHFLADLALREASLPSVRAEILNAAKALEEPANRNTVIEAMCKHRDPAVRLAALDAIDVLVDDSWRRTVLERSIHSYIGSDSRLVDAWFAAAGKLRKVNQRQMLFEAALQQESEPAIRSRLESQIPKTQ